MWDVGVFLSLCPCERSYTVRFGWVYKGDKIVQELPSKGEQQNEKAAYWMRENTYKS